MDYAHNRVAAARLPRSRRFAGWGAIASIANLILVLYILKPSIPDGSRNWYALVRGYFYPDQVSYAAIAANVRDGGSPFVEPFTETGVSYYPSLWYAFMGWVARTLGWSVPTSWTVLGYVAVCGGVLIAGLVAIRLSHRPWAPLVVGALLVSGTLSILTGSNWYTQLESHAVIWAGFGALYVLNAEGAALALAAVGLLTALLLALGLIPTRHPRIAWVFPGLAIGLTANIHTYPFFLASAVAIGWAGVAGLRYAPGPLWRWVMLAALGLTLLLGPIMADVLGQISAFGLFALAWAPGWLWLVRQLPGPSMVALLAFSVAAGFQVGRTLLGVLAGDEFLVYRQGSSISLGVPPLQALTAALPFILIVAFCLRVLRRDESAIRGLLLGGSAAVVFMVNNDRWGFQQEPYRFLIDSMVLGALVVGPILARAVAQCGEARDEGSIPWDVQALTALAVGVYALSLLDFGAFRMFVAGTGSVDIFSGKYAVIAELAGERQGLIATGPCLDPRLVKLATSGRVATYNRGIAWPDNREAIDGVAVEAASGVLTAATLERAAIETVIIDSACPQQWDMAKVASFTLQGSTKYDEVGSTISLWTAN